jgi:hypothetical protein
MLDSTVIIMRCFLLGTAIASHFQISTTLQAGHSLTSLPGGLDGRQRQPEPRQSLPWDPIRIFDSDDSKVKMVNDG